MSAGARGFTIVEVMITLVVLGVLITFGAPEFMAFLQNQKTRAGEEDSDELNCELALRAREAGRDGVDEYGRGEDSDEDERRDDERQHREDRPRDAVCLLLVVLREQTRVDRNEGGRESALAEDVLKEVRDAERRVEGVHRVGVAEEVCEDSLAYDADDAAQKDSGPDEERAPSGRERPPLTTRRDFFSGELARRRADRLERLARDTVGLVVHGFPRIVGVRDVVVRFFDSHAPRGSAAFARLSSPSSGSCSPSVIRFIRH